MDAVTYVLPPRQDGDMSTAWTCTGDPTEPDSGFFECTLRFSMFSYRHIKQVKIGEALAQP